MRLQIDMKPIEKRPLFDPFSRLFRLVFSPFRPSSAPRGRRPIFARRSRWAWSDGLFGVREFAHLYWGCCARRSRFANRCRGIFRFTGVFLKRIFWFSE